MGKFVSVLLCLPHPCTWGFDCPLGEQMERNFASGWIIHRDSSISYLPYLDEEILNLSCSVKGWDSGMLEWDGGILHIGWIWVLGSQKVGCGRHNTSPSKSVQFPVAVKNFLVWKKGTRLCRCAKLRLLRWGESLRNYLGGSNVITRKASV